MKKVRAIIPALLLPLAGSSLLGVQAAACDNACIAGLTERLLAALAHRTAPSSPLVDVLVCGDKFERRTGEIKAGVAAL